MFIEYSVIRDSIDVIDEVNLEIKIRRLEDKEIQLKIMNVALIIKKTIKPRDRSSSSLLDRRNLKANRRLRCFICSKSHYMRDCKYLNKVRVYAIKQIVKKRDTKIVDVKYSKKSKKHREYTANAETDTKNINSKKDYAEETVALSKDAVSKILRSE